MLCVLKALILLVSGRQGHGIRQLKSVNHLLRNQQLRYLHLLQMSVIDYDRNPIAYKSVELPVPVLKT